jgi:HPt (histidine-containing phosphotransfer) domain-containing protein
MNATAYAPPFFFQAPARPVPVPIPDGPEPLVRMENVAEFVGDDPETQQQVFNLCYDLLVTSLPRMRQAVDTGDTVTLGRLAHHFRGSLGMLGLPMLKELGEDVEYHHDDLGAERWRQRCEELYNFLTRLHAELREHVAA